MSGSRETRITIWESEKTDLCVVAADVLSDPRGAFRCRALQRHQDRGPIRRGCPPQQGAAPTAVQDSVLTYTIYVHRDDYDRAFAAIQSLCGENEKERIP